MRGLQSLSAEMVTSHQGRSQVLQWRDSFAGSSRSVYPNSDYEIRPHGAAGAIGSTCQPWVRCVRNPRVHFGNLALPGAVVRRDALGVA